MGYTWGEASSNFGSVPSMEGLTLGGGIDVAVADGWLVRAEYRTVMFDDIGTAPLTIDTTTHEARIGVLYRFNFEQASSAK